MSENENVNEIQNRKRMYNMEFKLKVFYHYENMKPKLSFRQTAKDFNIDRKQIFKWHKKLSQIDSIQHKRRSYRFKNTNDTTLNPPMETDLYNWIIAKREAGAVLDSLAIKQKALAIFNKISQEQNSIYIHIKFLASRGCLRNFCYRSLEIDFIYHWSRFASF